MALFLLAVAAFFLPAAQAQTCNQGTVEVPVLGNVNPTTGTFGTAITLSGANLGAETVNVGPLPVNLPNRTVFFNNGLVSDTAAATLVGSNLRVTAPANLTGPFSIIVQKRSFTGLVQKCYRYTNAFNYLPVPVVLGVTPELGVAQTVVSIAGLNFTDPSTVNIGGTPATSVQFQNEFSIFATIPGILAPGVYVVQVCNSSGLCSAEQVNFEYLPTPTVSAITPNSGFTTGGTAVTVTGTGFFRNGVPDLAAVYVGNVALTNLVVLNDTTATGVTGINDAGPALVDVQNLSGIFSTNNAALFTYIPAPVPVITSINPTQGPVAGGNSVTITGTALDTATAVTFNGAAAAITARTATTLTVTVPPGVAGPASVIVTNPFGTNAPNGTGVLPVFYTYVTITTPVISTIVPSRGPTAGGTIVALTGFGFTGVTSVTFGGNPAQIQPGGTDTQLEVITPAGVPGPTSVIVTNPAGSNAANTLFTYIPSPGFGALACVSNAGVPPLVRAEGLSELVGDLVLNCKGGTPTPAGQPVPRANIQIFLNTNITSRLTNDPWSEALLMIDEPSAAAQRYCSVNGGCAINGVGNVFGNDALPDGVDYDATALAPSVPALVPNVYQGRMAGANSIVWLGVPIDPPGDTATRIIRITNVRANANQLGVSSTLIPTQIVMYISVSGSTSVPINNPQQTVAFVQPGMTFSVRQAVKNYLQCVSFNPEASTSTSATLRNGLGTVVRFAEGFATAFKRRTSAAYVDGNTSPNLVPQNTPGAIYNSETGFYNPAPTVAEGDMNGLNEAGLAAHGTRLMARFANVPAGVSLYASVYPVTSSTTNAGCLGAFGSACITGVQNSANGIARLTNTDANGGGGFSAAMAAATSQEGAAMAPLTVSGGNATAVWEVLNADPLQSETLEFGIGVAFTANTANNLPGLGAATVAGSFAPLSTVVMASNSAAIPRFANVSNPTTAFTINSCSTNLLFPFLTNQAGFDSGIAISNTSSDGYGTSPQSGACKLNYYGDTTGGGAAPTAQTSAAIPAGKQLTAVLSTGGNYGIAATPGFQGYLIAQCAFQYAHGFAFISDVGANRISEAYLALVLDGGLSSRTLFSSEVLGH